MKNAMKLFAVALTTLAMSGISFAQAKPATPATPATPAVPAAPATEKKIDTTGADNGSWKAERQGRGKS